MTEFTFPPDLDTWLQEQAAEFGRSKEEHIIFLLEAVRQTAQDNRERIREIEIEDPLDDFFTFTDWPVL